MKSIFTILFLFVLSSTTVNAEISQLDLERAWSKAVVSGYGEKITGVTIHVSPTKTYVGSEVADRYGRRTFFSSRELGVSRAGYDQTERLVALKTAELSARGLEPKSTARDIPETTIYVRSNHGSVTAIDAESGAVKWTSQAGKKGYPSLGVAATDDYVVAVSSTKIMLLDAATGDIMDSKMSHFLPTATPSVFQDLIYLPTRIGVVEVLSAGNLSRTEFTLGSAGSISAPVTLSPNSTSWVTDRGLMYVANLGTPGIRYHFQSTGTITAAPVYANATLFATSMDGFAYAVDESTGDLRWRYSAGGPVREAPVVVDGSVLVTTTDGHLSSLDAATGEPKWTASGVEKIISVSESRIYAITVGQTLTAFDKSTGKRANSVSAQEVSLPIQNKVSDRVYLVNQSGILQCYREAGKRWPMVRLPEVAIEEETTDTSADEIADIADPAPTADNTEDDANEGGDLFGLDEDNSPASDAPDAGDDEGDPFDDFGADDAESGEDNPFGDPF